MIKIKCKGDLLKIDNDNVRSVVESRIACWMYEDEHSDGDGYLILIENGEDDIDDLPHLNVEDGGLWDSDIWECCDLIDGVYFIVIICNNEFSIEFAVIDDEYLDLTLAGVIDKYMVDNASYIAEMKRNQVVASCNTVGK